MKNYTKQDFLETDKPYQELYALNGTPSQHAQAFSALQKNARAVGIRNFKKLYEVFLYYQAQWKVKNKMENQRELNLTIWKSVKDGFRTYLSENESAEISHIEAEQALQYAISQLSNVPIKF